MLDNRPKMWYNCGPARFWLRQCRKFPLMSTPTFHMRFPRGYLKLHFPKIGAFWIGRPAPAHRILRSIPVIWIDYICSGAAFIFPIWHYIKYMLYNNISYISSLLIITYFFKNVKCAKAHGNSLFERKPVCKKGKGEYIIYMKFEYGC